ncbi:alanine racemase [Mangrovitalea sediminis]|uniref:alanine racemase n=1 Tax=Mangrovitalea sediminis TaxID=1982043 RepID=UPI000BE57231|nr:alanine racemase [Mangrovitalea sediminis]
MSRAASADIDLNAILHNYRLAKRLAPASCAVAVIKADAYGHGAVAVARALHGDADAFAVACIEEALELREAGITLPILLLEGFFEEDELETIAREQLWCTIHSPHQIEALKRTRLPQPIHVWLKLDSGMHRVGISPPDYQTTYNTLRGLQNVGDVVLMTHLACADELNSPNTDAQIACFDAASAGLEAPASLANSAATLAWPQAHRNWLRPGMMLYGASPFTHPQDHADHLQPAMTLHSRIIAIRDLQAGDSIGYGADYVCKHPSRVATVAMGYGDGYPRQAKSGTPVMVKGRRTGLVGRVSMDMLSIDVTELPDAQVGDTVEFWGKNLSLNEVADYCNTIPYTLVTGISRRVPRRYRASASARPGKVPADPAGVSTGLDPESRIPSIPLA